MSEAHASVDVAQQARFRFEAVFAGTTLAPVLTDEPPPLGEGRGPNPIRLLAAAVATCLAASLQFALEQRHVDPQPIGLPRISTSTWCRTKQAGCAWARWPSGCRSARRGPTWRRRRACSISSMRIAY
jgi:hypothetical protein